MLPSIKCPTCKSITLLSKDKCKKGICRNYNDVHIKHYTEVTPLLKTTNKN